MRNTRKFLGWGLTLAIIIVTHLRPPDASAYDNFGFTGSVSDDTPAIGETGDDDGDGGSGSAFIFARSGGVWTQQQKLVASDAEVHDLFGYSVSVSGDYVVVGALGNDTMSQAN